MLGLCRPLELDRRSGEPRQSGLEPEESLCGQRGYPATRARGLKSSSSAESSRSVPTAMTMSKITVSDREVTDAFNANRAQFNVPEEAYHIAQIVVTPVRDQQVGNANGDDATTPQQA